MAGPENLPSDDPGLRDGSAVDQKRLWSRLETLGRVGSYEDDATGEVGVRRLALTPEDVEGRRLVEGWMSDQGLNIERDPIGNTFGWRVGSDPSASPVVMGSHIDSVTTAGRFDGCLGVIGALEVLAICDDLGIRTRRGLVAAFFTDEEGVRFGSDMLGSSVTGGRVAADRALALVDESGASVASELARRGLAGEAPWLYERPPFTYLETHIEQGPVLLDRGLPVGVVTGVQGISWWRVRFKGAAAHAGGAPMAMRHDAGLAAALMRVRVHELSTEFPTLRGTAGQIQTRPGAQNVVPAWSDLTFDLRSVDDDVLTEVDSRVRLLAVEVAEECACTVDHIEQNARTSAVRFDPMTVGEVERTVLAHGHGAYRLVSGAGHDAQEMAAISPTAMVFVRSQNGGASHTPLEYSSPEDCAAGVAVMASLAIELANRE